VNDALHATVVAFEAVGATRPVEIPAGQVGPLLAALDAWAARGDLPWGVAALSDALG
jgi:hypothetical protein